MGQIWREIEFVKTERQVLVNQRELLATAGKGRNPPKVLIVVLGFDVVVGLSAVIPVHAVVRPLPNTECPRVGSRL